MEKIEQVDILIVGSGPTGISTALHLLQLDPSWAGRMVVVDKAVHPREKLCGGGITHLGQNVLADLGLTIEPTNFAVHEVRLVYDELAYSFYGNPVFRIVRRAEFDHWFMRQARAKGVDVREGEAVKTIEEHPDYIAVQTTKRLYHAGVLIAADGSRSYVRQKLKWDDDSRVARLLEVLTPEEPQRQPEFRDRVAVFDFSRMPAGLQGYYWDFPSIVDGQPMMNRGVFDSRARPERPKAPLKDVLGGALAERERDLDDYKLKGHPIRWFDREGKFARPRVLLAGDAAGVDPLFGEGIAFALGYGRVAAAAVAAAFAAGDFRFADYRERILRDPLLRQLPWRVAIARFAYKLRSPRLFRLGWQVARLVIRFTRWRDPSYVPAHPPRLQLAAD